ncbi:hypothetical protein ES703_13516 [subsurface metagenome]
MAKKDMRDLEEVAKLFESIHPVPEGAYWLYAHDKKIKLSLGPELGADVPQIAQLDSTEINEGLAPERWRAIDAQIKKLRKEGKLCCQKHRRP